MPVPIPLLPRFCTLILLVCGMITIAGFGTPARAEEEGVDAAGDKRENDAAPPELAPSVVQLDVGSTDAGDKSLKRGGVALGPEEPAMHNARRTKWLIPFAIACLTSVLVLTAIIIVFWVCLRNLLEESSRCLHLDVKKELRNLGEDFHELSKQMESREKQSHSDETLGGSAQRGVSELLREWQQFKHDFDTCSSGNAEHSGQQGIELPELYAQIREELKQAMESPISVEQVSKACEDASNEYMDRMTQFSSTEQETLKKAAEIATEEAQTGRSMVRELESKNLELQQQVESCTDDMHLQAEQIEEQKGRIKNDSKELEEEQRKSLKLDNVLALLGGETAAELIAAFESAGIVRGSGLRALVLSLLSFEAELSGAATFDQLKSSLMRLDRLVFELLQQSEDQLTHVRTILQPWLNKRLDVRMNIEWPEPGSPFRPNLHNPDGSAGSVIGLARSAVIRGHGGEVILPARVSTVAI